jgi:hypothetical protein
MVTAITEQRDRFRSANAALEAENAALKKREAALELETRTLRTDNVKMYEKIKFLEAYRPLTGQTLHSVCAVLFAADVASFPPLLPLHSANSSSSSWL